MNTAIKDVIEFINDNDVEFIRLIFCDLFGTMKNIIITPNEIEKAFDYGVSFDGSSIKGFADTDKSDLILLPDPTTISASGHRPYEGLIVSFYCDVLKPDHEPYEFDSRYILKKAVERCKNEGLIPKIGTECEFYLFVRDENGKPTYEPVDDGGYLDVYPLDNGEKIRKEICLRMKEVGLVVETSHHENGPGQNEIDFKYSDALYAADCFLTFKNIVKTVAAINGLHASFMPKPLLDESGNGLHINISLEKNNLNIFAKENIQDKDISESFIAGILNRINEMMAVLCPIENSYERLGKYLAPKYISWSHQNRSQLIRIPAAAKDATRMELRVADPVINPYLAFSLLLHAGLEGIKNKEVLSKSCDLDLFALDNEKECSLAKLSDNLKYSLSLMEKSEFVNNVLGSELVKKYVSLKSKELEKQINGDYLLKQYFYKI